MKYETSTLKATNAQLWHVIEHETFCSTPVMSVVVSEALDRGMFDYLITHVSKKMIRNIEKFLEKNNLEYQDFYQVCRMAVFEVMKSFKPNEASFKTLAYIAIKSKIIKLFERERAEKRKVYEGVTSLNLPSIFRRRKG